MTNVARAAAVVRKVLAGEGDHYSVLGVTRSARIEEIKNAYKKLVVAVHPDKNETPEAKEAFELVRSAYEVLGDANKRVTYDANRPRKEREKKEREERERAKQEREKKEKKEKEKREREVR